MFNRVLILSVSAGAGHIRAAQAVAPTYSIGALACRTHTRGTGCRESFSTDESGA